MIVKMPSGAQASVTELIGQLRASGLPTEMASHILDKVSARQNDATVRTVEPASHERRNGARSEGAR